MYDVTLRSDSSINFEIDRFLNWDVHIQRRIDEYDGKEYTIKRYTEYEPLLIQTTALNRFAEYFQINKDLPEYRSLEAQVKQELNKYNMGLLQSNRQIVVVGKDCISAIHLTLGKNPSINCFQRSANIKTLMKNDFYFICWLGLRVLPEGKKHVRHIISIPHKWEVIA